jgi:class 3 adenylate cyclase
MLPAKALKKIGKGGVFIKQYHMVSIFFCDIVGYTSMATEMQPIEVMEMLNSFFKEVDILAEKHKVYKIKIIGDAYMCVGGCPDRCSAFEGAERVASFALDLIEFVKSFRADDGLQISVRAGIHSGAVVAGAIERKRPQYTIFGHAVDVASSMESSSHVMKIQCSHVTSNLLNQAPNYGFSLVERGFTVNSKELGQFKTYFIEGARKYIQ